MLSSLTNNGRRIASAIPPVVSTVFQTCWLKVWSHHLHSTIWATNAQRSVLLIFRYWLLVRREALRVAPYCPRDVLSTSEGRIQEQGMPEWIITPKIVRRALRDRRVTASHPCSVWFVLGLLLLLLVSGFTYSTFSLHSHDSYRMLRREGVCRSRSLNF